MASIQFDENAYKFKNVDKIRSIILGSPMNKIQGQGQGEQFKCK